jgi:F-type H+-transporting ATPase subunit beta
LDDALDGCKRILADEFKDFPESAFYMIGAIDEARKKGDNKAETDKSDTSLKKNPDKVTEKQPK